MIVPVVQGSPAWAAWKLKGLGSTDAPAIWAAHQGVRGAKRDLDALLGRKLAPPPADQRYPADWRRRGPTDAVAELSRRVGWELRPACVQHQDATWLRATLQGITWAGDALAAVGSLRVAEHEQVLAGELPARLLPAVQHALLASGAALCWFVSRTESKRFAEGERFAVIEVAEDGELQAALLQAEQSFWTRLQKARGVRESA